MVRSAFGFLIGFASATAALWILAGHPASGDQTPTGYTLEDIYRFIVTNGGTNPVEGNHPLVPASSPGQGGFHTLADIVAALREKLPCAESVAPCRVPATGETACYSARGTMPCAAAPGQDGYYRKGCPVAARFTDNGDGTITDACTGLVWQKTDTWGKTWLQALAYCESLDYAGHTDWRLPNVREMFTLLDYGRPAPTSNPVLGLRAGEYYTSTTYHLDLNQRSAYVVEFQNGQIWPEMKSGAIGTIYFRAVRSAR